MCIMGIVMCFRYKANVVNFVVNDRLLIVLELRFVILCACECVCDVVLCLI